MKNPPETWPERDPAPAPSLKTEPVTFALPTESALLSARIHAILPQTQCTRCGYADCAGYADALVGGQADLNQCAPGGMEGIMRLADVLQRQPKPLNAVHGPEKPRVLAVIEEEWCIGCTKCLDACPTDAILGASKRMHTVIDSHCTGCELCIPVCPVDCIRTLDASGTRTGWAAWSETQASQALVRYQQHSARIAHKTNTAESLVRVENFPADALERDIPEKSLQGIQIPLHSASSTAAHQKRALIEAAMQRARTLKTL